MIIKTAWNWHKDRHMDQWDRTESRNKLTKIWSQLSNGRVFSPTSSGKSTNSRSTPSLWMRADWTGYGGPPCPEPCHYSQGRLVVPSKGNTWGQVVMRRKDKDHPFGEALSLSGDPRYNQSIEKPFSALFCGFHTW